MSDTIVLVHGAFHGGWFWRPVAERLRANGLNVLTPTLTGLGERSHLRTTGTDLALHVRDILAVLDAEQDTGVHLVGHSYGGMVVTVAAALGPGRIGSVTCLDGFVPRAGECALDLLPAGPSAHYRESIVELDGVAVIPPRPLERLGVTDPQVLATLPARLGPQPAATYRQPAAAGIDEVACPGTYLLCTGWATPFEPMAQRAASYGWDGHHVAGDHEIAVTAPDLLVKALLHVVN